MTTGGVRSMRGVRPTPGGAVELVDLPEPVPGPLEVLLDVRATALNRADLLQVRGLYPPPPGESEVPGLEAAGEVSALGPGVEGWEVGQRVMALLAGGGHATRVAVPAGQLMAIPGNLTFEQAAALPEAALTAYTNLAVEAGLVRGQSVLIVAAASGVGSFAVQLARALGAEVLVAGRNLERLLRLRALGAQHCFALGEDLPREVRAATDGQGVDVVLDLMGGPTLGTTLSCLRERGCLVLVGLMAGSGAQLDLAVLMRRRLRLVGSVLRSRSRAEKAGLVASFIDFARDLLADGRLRPVIDRVLPFEELPEAYRALAEGGALGKIVLRVDHFGSAGRSAVP